MNSRVSPLSNLGVFSVPRMNQLLIEPADTYVWQRAMKFLKWIGEKDEKAADCLTLLTWFISDCQKLLQSTERVSIPSITATVIDKFLKVCKAVGVEYTIKSADYLWELWETDKLSDGILSPHVEKFFSTTMSCIDMRWSTAEIQYIDFQDTEFFSRTIVDILIWCSTSHLEIEKIHSRKSELAAREYSEINRSRNSRKMYLTMESVHYIPKKRRRQIANGSQLHSDQRCYNQDELPDEARGADLETTDRSKTSMCHLKLMVEVLSAVSGVYTSWILL